MRWMGIILVSLGLLPACGSNEPQKPIQRRSPTADQQVQNMGAESKKGTATTANGTSSPAGNGNAPSAKSAAPVADSNCIEAEKIACDIEAAILNHVNKFRADNGKPPLQFKGGKMSWLARYWSKVQGDRGGLGHDGWRSGLYETVYPQKFGEAHPPILAENCVTQDGDDDPEVIAGLMVGWWIGSPGHRANMLGDYQYIGIGAYKKGKSIFGTGNNWWGTQIFY